MSTNTTARPATISRTSTTKPAPPPIQAHPASLLHPSCVLTGTHPITLSAYSIVQLRTRLNTTYAPITVAEGAIIAERCQIGLLSSSSSSSVGVIEGAGKEKERDDSIEGSIATDSITIGRHALIESTAIIEAKSIGAYAVIGAGAKLGPGCVIGEGATICPLVEIGPGDVVRAGEVVWGAGGPGERRADGSMGRGGSGVRLRKEAVEGLAGVYRRLWVVK